MAVFTPVLETYGWETDEAVVVQTPLFEHDVTIDFAVFDWFSEVDATKLTNAVIERGLAAGWEDVESNVITPVADSSEASLASTFANLQKLFTDLNFGDCIDEDFNTTTATVGNATGFLTWSTVATEDELTDEEYFEAFCIKAGLTDGGGNYGFRYIDYAGGTPSVEYPNSNRTVTADDVIYDPSNLDIYLEDILAALERIKFVGWEKPDDINRFGRKFTWGTLDSLDGIGDSDDSYDPSVGWGGEQSVEFSQAKTDFVESGGSLTEPGALAESKGELEINSSTSEYTSTITSELAWSAIHFDTTIEGDWDVNLNAETPVSADSFDPLGSSISEGWSIPLTGTNSTDESVETGVIGATSMDTDLFIETGVPVWTLTVLITPSSSTGDEPFDWLVGSSSKISGGIPDNEDIFGNINGASTWDGELSASPLGDDNGEALNLSYGFYEGTYLYELFSGSSNEDSDIGFASATVNAVPPPSPSASATPTPSPTGSF